MAKTEWKYLSDLQDYQGPIDKLILLLTKYKKQYGSKAIVRLDAGYNNVSVQVEQRIKEKKESNE